MKLGVIILILFLLPSYGKAEDMFFIYNSEPPSLQKNGLFLKQKFSKNYRGNDNSVLVELGYGLSSNVSVSFQTSFLDQNFYQASVRTNIYRNESLDFAVIFNGGVNRKGSTSLRAIFVGNKEIGNFQILSNVIFEKNFGQGFDAIDLIISGGVGYKLSSFVSVGVESILQDIEDAWEEDEAEGGARIFVGPVLSLNYKKKFYFTSGVQLNFNEYSFKTGFLVNF